MEPSVTRLEAALEVATKALLSERRAAGPWTGELSSSALSTATAVAALAVVQREAGIQEHDARIAVGLDWLSAHQNDDGGWGDTTKSLSNLSTTVLCWAAFGVVPESPQKYPRALARAEEWLRQKAGALDPDQLAPAVIARYGKDRTFSVPILTMCALSGRLGSGREAWRHVIPLPFELAACPASWFAALKLPVVSYALPALIAIGQARHHHRPSWNPVPRLIRNATRELTLKVLARIQPPNGGFLEATPLTSFVTMSLAGSGRVHHPVTRSGVGFLLASQRSDGSWPIDTNLSTWVTTLAVNALGEAAHRPEVNSSSIGRWLLDQQYRSKHPYTNAAPGGWAWTDLPGGVPDADDTAGALIALSRLQFAGDGLKAEMLAAATAGLEWLLNLQNTDGGIPTFCRGWGALPFDRSSPDITAHAICAWLNWLREVSPSLKTRILKSVDRAVNYLSGNQLPNGSWMPLWFGNQLAGDDGNPAYGTARVVRALAEVLQRPEVCSTRATSLCQSGVRWLLEAQNPDGGWGGDAGVPSSTEETALAVEALACARTAEGLSIEPTLRRGTVWLIEHIEAGTWTNPSPIGFYFAKLWYFERLYPIIFTVGALTSAVDRGRLKA